MSKSHAHTLHFVIAALLLAGIGLLCGCTPREQSGPGGHQVGHASALEQIGHISICIGGIALLVIGLARAAAFFPATAFLLVFTPLMGEAAALAATAIIIGSCLVWVGLHFWIVYLSAVAVAGVYVIRHRKILGVWIASFKKVAVEKPEAL